MNQRKIFRSKTKVEALTISSSFSVPFNIFLIISLFSLFLNCGGEKGGQAPSGAPSAPQAVEQPAQVSGGVQSIVQEVTGKYTVTILDASDNPLLQFETDENGNFTKEFSRDFPEGDFVLRAERPGQAPLETVVRLEKGVIEEAEITDVSTLVLFFGRILFPVEADEDNAESLKEFIEQRFSKAEIDQAVQELNAQGKGGIGALSQMFNTVLRNYRPISD